MPIFRYTFKKILVSPSTWVIFFITLIVLGLTWSLPIVLFTTGQPEINWTKELVLNLFLPNWKLLTFTAFIGLMLLIFIGVKATQIFRDEIDDGTLLILVSKPITRNRIWIEKWLSFQVTVILYIFSSIFSVSLLFILPRIGGLVVYLTLLPYVGILLGVSLLFDLIFTSAILLLSLILNSKATIAIAVGFTALTNIFSQAIDPLVDIPMPYFQYSHAVAVYHDIEKKTNADDFNWFEKQLNNLENYQSEIKNIMKKVYKINISDINYPNEYDPIREQEILNDIIANPSKSEYSEYSKEDISLIIHVVRISNVFRQWKQQSYQELMTSIPVGKNYLFYSLNKNTNRVNYSAWNVIQIINKPIDQNALDICNSKILQKRITRYFNIFYQLYYLWNGSLEKNSSLYISDAKYKEFDDTYIISFDKNNNNNYKVNLASGTSRILNFSVLISFYIILGLVLLVFSWYIFNRRDFT